MVIHEVDNYFARLVTEDRLNCLHWIACPAFRIDKEKYKGTPNRIENVWDIGFKCSWKSLHFYRTAILIHHFLQRIKSGRVFFYKNCFYARVFIDRKSVV